MVGLGLGIAGSLPQEFFGVLKLWVHPALPFGINTVPLMDPSPDEIRHRLLPQP